MSFPTVLIKYRQLQAGPFTHLKLGHQSSDVSIEILLAVLRWCMEWLQLNFMKGVVKPTTGSRLWIGKSTVSIHPTTTTIPRLISFDYRSRAVVTSSTRVRTTRRKVLLLRFFHPGNCWVDWLRQWWLSLSHNVPRQRCFPFFYFVLSFLRLWRRQKSNNNILTSRVPVRVWRHQLPTATGIVDRQCN